MAFSLSYPARPGKEHIGVDTHAVIAEEFGKGNGVVFEEFSLLVIAPRIGDDAVLADGEKGAGLLEELAGSGENKGVGFVLGHAHPARQGDDRLSGP